MRRRGRLAALEVAPQLPRRHAVILRRARTLLRRARAVAPRAERRLLMAAEQGEVLVDLGAERRGGQLARLELGHGLRQR